MTTKRRFTPTKQKDEAQEAAKKKFDGVPPPNISTEGVSVEAQRAILENDLKLWINTRYKWEHQMASERRLVQMDLANEDGFEAAKKEHGKCMSHIVYYEEELAKLPPKKAI